MRLGQVCVSLAAAALMTLLVWQGVTVLRERWRLAALDSFVHARWWGNPSPATLPSSLTDWRPGNSDGRRWAGYSQALVMAANTRTAGRFHLLYAAAATEKSLSLTPAQPAAWARLALLRLNLGANDKALAALRLSWRTGPAMRGLAWARSQLALYLWPVLPDADRRAAISDIRQVWRQAASAALPYPRQALVRFAHGAVRLDAVREALPKGEHALLDKRIQSVLMEAASAS